MIPYIHRVAYYETDRLGITHHSNYIRWMEEARVDYLDQLGWNFAKLESMGVSSPVLGAKASYAHPTTFDDRVAIEVAVTHYTGIRTKFSYTMRLLRPDGSSGDVVCTGETEHCFVGPAGRPMRVNRELPEFDAVMKSQLEASSEA